MRVTDVSSRVADVCLLRHLSDLSAEFISVIVLFILKFPFHSLDPLLCEVFHLSSCLKNVCDCSSKHTRRVRKLQSTTKFPVSLFILLSNARAHSHRQRLRPVGNLGFVLPTTRQGRVEDICDAGPWEALGSPEKKDGRPRPQSGWERRVFGGDSAPRSSLMLLPVWPEPVVLVDCPGPARSGISQVPGPALGCPCSLPPPTQEKERQRLENLRRKEEAEQLRRQKVEEDKRRRLEEVKL